MTAWLRRWHELMLPLQDHAHPKRLADMLDLLSDTRMGWKKQVAGYPSNLARDAVEANARSGWSPSIRQSRLFDFEADVTNLVGRIR
jgi:hypothetical protein